MGFGAASSVLVVFIAARMEVTDREGLPFHVGGRFFVYFPWLMKEIFVANLHVAKIILDPKLPITPILVHYRASQETDLGRAIYANSITLTPGTVSIDLSGDRITVHALTDAAAQGLATGEMDRRVQRLEGP